MSSVNNVSSHSSNSSSNVDEKRDVSNDEKDAFKKALHEKSALADNNEKLKSLLTKNEKALSASILKNQEASSEQSKMSTDSMSAESMMASLFNAQNQAGNSMNKDITAASGASSNLSSDSVQEIADRILTATKADGSQEVRISLSDKALAGTEVTINRALDGQLSVQFNTSNANSFQTLVAAQDALKEALNQTNTDVKVEVHNDSNNADRESQGKFEYSSQEDEA